MTEKKGVGGYGELPPPKDAVVDALRQQPELLEGLLAPAFKQVRAGVVDISVAELLGSCFGINPGGRSIEQLSVDMGMAELRLEDRAREILEVVRQNLLSDNPDTARPLPDMEGRVGPESWRWIYNCDQAKRLFAARAGDGDFDSFCWLPVFNDTKLPAKVRTYVDKVWEGDRPDDDQVVVGDVLEWFFGSRLFPWRRRWQDDYNPKRMSMAEIAQSIGYTNTAGYRLLSAILYRLNEDFEAYFVVNDEGGRAEQLAEALKTRWLLRLDPEQEI